MLSQIMIQLRARSGTLSPRPYGCAIYNMFMQHVHAQDVQGKRRVRALLGIRRTDRTGRVPRYVAYVPPQQCNHANVSRESARSTDQGAGNSLQRSGIDRLPVFR